MHSNLKGFRGGMGYCGICLGFVLFGSCYLGYVIDKLLPEIRAVTPIDTVWKKVVTLFLFALCFMRFVCTRTFSGESLRILPDFHNHLIKVIMNGFVEHVFAKPSIPPVIGECIAFSRLQL